MDIHVEDIEHYYNTPGGDSNKFVAKIEDIPENKVPINVVKQNKKVAFSANKPSNNSKQTNQIVEQTQTKPSIPKTQAKIVRPIQPPPKPQITYDDIISKMGMVVINGELHFKGNSPPPQNHGQNTQNQGQGQNMYQNTYIYNKYFKDTIDTNDQPRRPRTLL